MSQLVTYGYPRNQAVTTYTGSGKAKEALGREVLQALEASRSLVPKHVFHSVAGEFMTPHIDLDTCVAQT
jgi:hypothetical protein